MTDDTTRRLRERTGLDIVGCYAFGAGPVQADELLAFVSRGTKRATVGALVELEQLDDPSPSPGQLWGLLDGAGAPRYVAETVEVVAGRLDEVTPAFALDEGEDDGTLEAWLEGHRGWAEQLGVADPAQLEVLFERFRIVWPIPDRETWLTDGVRLLRSDERSWLETTHLDRHGQTEVRAHAERWPLASLPALVCEDRGERLGVLLFRPRPGGSPLVFGVEVLRGDDEVERRLRRGLAELGRRFGWVQEAEVLDLERAATDAPSLCP